MTNSGSTHAKDVREFMSAIGQPLPKEVGWPDRATLRLRLRLLAEELAELAEACGYRYNFYIADDHYHPIYSSQNVTDPAIQPSMAAVADSLVDLEYVLLGTYHAFGLDSEPLWQEVHTANMKKVGGPVVDGKQEKPEGWRAPDINAVLERQGFRE